MVFEDSESGIPDFESYKIIFVGALLLSLQYLLLKINTAIKPINILLKLVAFIITLYFLKSIAANISPALTFSYMTTPVISYNNNTLWLLSVIVLLTVGIIVSLPDSKPQINSLKYIGVAGVVVTLHSLFMIALAIPPIVLIVIQHLSDGSL